jgi:antitoxin CptB
MTETAEARLKRMKMRSWRRGTKEMDLALGPWADAHLAGLGPRELDLYDRLLQENDQDLMAWITGTAVPPGWIVPLLEQVRSFAASRLGRGG